jgi:hypothetical protein
MDDILSIPSRAYHYVNNQYGTIGLIVVGLLITVAIVGVFVWWDRRK